MSIKHTRTVVGTKPLAAIVAEFQRTLPAVVPTKPSGDGWLESCQLRAALKVGENAFGQLAKKQVEAGVWQREVGTKIGRTGVMCRTYYYRVKKA